MPFTFFKKNNILLLEVIVLFNREITDKFMNVANSRKVVLLTGARQVGKSTFIKSIKEDNREYVTLDNLTLRELANSDPLMFLMN